MCVTRLMVRKQQQKETVRQVRTGEVLGAFPGTLPSIFRPSSAGSAVLVSAPGQGKLPQSKEARKYRGSRWGSGEETDDRTAAGAAPDLV
jgi:hypothetical protein